MPKAEIGYYVVMKQLILASGSVGRRTLLEKIGHPFIVDVSNYEEDMTFDMPPEKLAIFLSKGKAEDVVTRHKNAVILAADSFVVYKNHLLGKPHTQKRAKEMLQMLSGSHHSFVTGFTIIDADTGKQQSESVRTEIFFRDLSDSEIETYIKRDDVRQKAGAYTVQGAGSAFIRRIDGDYSNIVGLPLAPVIEALRKFDINLL